MNKILKNFYHKISVCFNNNSNINSIKIYKNRNKNIGLKEILFNNNLNKINCKIKIKIKTYVIYSNNNNFHNKIKLIQNNFMKSYNFL